MTVETTREAPVHDRGRLRTDRLGMIDGELDTSFTLLKGFLAALSNGMVDDSAEARREYYAIMLRQSAWRYGFTARCFVRLVRRFAADEKKVLLFAGAKYAASIPTSNFL